MIRFLLFGAGMVAAIFVVLCVFLYLNQDSMLFYRIVNDRMLARQWQAHRVRIPADDATIEGWWAENPQGKSDATLIYFGGNAEDVLYTADRAALFSARRMLVTNYRGCGGTRGKPSQKALYRDALAIYDYAVKQPGVSAGSVVVMGRSLGSGQATFVAANRPVRAAILITPYDSMTAVAQGHYSFIPVRWILRNKFPSEEFARTVTAPALILAAERDGIVPPIHARRLCEAWVGPKELHVLEEAGHNSIGEHPQYYALINSFLERTAQ